MIIRSEGGERRARPTHSPPHARSDATEHSRLRSVPAYPAYPLALHATSPSRAPTWRALHAAAGSWVLGR